MEKCRLTKVSDPRVLWSKIEEEDIAIRDNSIKTSNELKHLDIFLKLLHNKFRSLFVQCLLHGCIIIQRYLKMKGTFLLYLLLTKRQTETNNSASAIFKWFELKNFRIVDIEINAWSLSFINNKINLISVLYPEKGMQFNQWSVLYILKLKVLTAMHSMRELSLDGNW